MLSRRKEFILRSGKTEVEIPQGSNEPHTFELMNVSYGDITGDGEEEAIVLIRMRARGNANPYALFVYSLVKGVPEMLWVHETGDRADEGLRNVYVSGEGVLVIEQYIDEVGLCCPKKFTRRYYEWREHGFQKAREEILPNEYGDARTLVGLSSHSL